MSAVSRNGTVASTRIPLYDNAKFLLMCSVVVGHLLRLCELPERRYARALYVFIYAFHMPLFLFISGLFVDRGRMTRESTLRHVARYFALGMLAKLIRTSGRWLLGAPFHVNLFYEHGFPWFMFALATYYALAWLLRRQSYLTVGCIAVLVALAAGYTPLIGGYLCLSRIIVFFPFFWLGHALDARRAADRLAKPATRCACLGIVAALAFVFLVHTKDLYPFLKLFMGRYSYARVKLAGWGWANRALAYVIATALGAGIFGIVSHRKLPLITTWGQRTLQVYLFHFGLVSLLGKYQVVQRLFGWGRWGWLALILLGVLITCLLSLPDIQGACRRVFPRRKDPKHLREALAR